MELSDEQIKHRFAVAWDACEGISTEALEDGVIADIIAFVNSMVNFSPRAEKLSKRLSPTKEDVS